MSQPQWVRLYRVLFGVLALIAIVVMYRNDSAEVSFRPGNFFSLFTVQSNAIAASVLLIGAVGIARAGLRWEVVRGAAAMYLVTTGIVYGFLIDGFDNPFTTDKAWTHTVLHQVMPIVMVLDLFIRPLLHRLEWRVALLWTAYPILYLVYSLIRGAIVDWYPYDFINPHEVGGYGGVALYAITIAAGFLAIALVMVRLSQPLRRGMVSAEAGVVGSD